MKNVAGSVPMGFTVWVEEDVLLEFIKERVAIYFCFMGHVRDGLALIAVRDEMAANEAFGRGNWQKPS